MFKKLIKSKQLIILSLKTCNSIDRFNFGFLLTLSYININNFNNDENFLFGKNNALLNEQILLPIVSSFLPEESIKVTKNESEEDSIINAADYGRNK